MEFGANKMPVEVITEGMFGGTYFRDIYSSVTGKWCKKSWKEFDQLKDIDQKFFCSDYYVSVNKYGVKCRTLLRFWENKGWINEIDPYGWFQWYFRYWLGRSQKMIKDESVDGKKLQVGLKVNWTANSKFDDYSISPKIRQILLYWGY